MDGTIVFASAGAPGLMRVSAAGGEPTVLTAPKEGERHNWPELLPGGKAVLFTISEGEAISVKKVAVLSLETGEIRTLLDGTDARYALSGHLVFGREASMWAVGFDVARATITGTPAPVVEDVQVNGGGGLALFALADDGSLAYFSGTGSKLILSEVDRKGVVTPLLAEPRSFVEPRVSPDGSRIAVELDGDIWVLDKARKALSRLTVGGGHQPRWTLDGERLAYVGTDNAIYWMPADGSGEPELFAGPEQGNMHLGSWTTGRDTMLLSNLVTPTQLLILQQGGSLETFRSTPFDDRIPEVSPDGRWLLYQSNETGRWEVYLEPYPGPGEHIQVSLAGGRQPSWSRDGHEIFYRGNRAMMVVTFDEQMTSLVGQPRKLFEEGPGYARGSDIYRYYDPAPDGQSFVMAREPSSQENGEIRVVLNFLDELEQRVPAK